MKKPNLYQKGKGGLIEGRKFKRGGFVENAKEDDSFTDLMFDILKEKIKRHA